jgi:hypothetical protein
MYRREEVNKFRKRCHPKNKNDLEQYKPLFAGIAKEKRRTDCQGGQTQDKMEAASRLLPTKTIPTIAALYGLLPRLR